MKIINPLYDKAFKYLMENNRWATKVISVILDEEIEELKLNQQETVFPDNKHQLTLFRLDFKATIKKNDGTKHTVLIELQKSKYITDILRFRNYLGSNYMKAEYFSECGARMPLKRFRWKGQKSIISYHYHLHFRIQPG